VLSRTGETAVSGMLVPNLCPKKPRLSPYDAIVVVFRPDAFNWNR